jgi:hypothetical protein
VEGSCEHGNEPSGPNSFWKFLSSYVTGGFSGRAQLYAVSLGKATALKARGKSAHARGS